MRHQKAGRKFSRSSSHRHAMFSNMVTSLILHERIETTEPKAKELKRLADRTISWGMSVADVASKDYKKLSAAERARLVHAKRMASRVVVGSEALSKLFHDVAPRLQDHKGGYTRLLKTRLRRGDAAPMAFVEIVARAVEETPAPPPDKKGKKKAEAKAEAAPPEKKPKKAKKADKAESEST